MPKVVMLQEKDQRIRFEDYEIVTPEFSLDDQEDYERRGAKFQKIYLKASKIYNLGSNVLSGQKKGTRDIPDGGIFVNGWEASDEEIDQLTEDLTTLDIEREKFYLQELVDNVIEIESSGEPVEFDLGDIKVIYSEASDTIKKKIWEKGIKGEWNKDLERHTLEPIVRKMYGRITPSERKKNQRNRRQN